MEAMGWTQKPPRLQGTARGERLQGFHRWNSSMLSKPVTWAEREEGEGSRGGRMR